MKEIKQSIRHSSAGTIRILKYRIQILGFHYSRWVSGFILCAFIILNKLFPEWQSGACHLRSNGYSTHKFLKAFWVGFSARVLEIILSLPHVWGVISLSCLFIAFYTQLFSSKSKFHVTLIQMFWLRRTWVHFPHFNTNFLIKMLLGFSITVKASIKLKVCTIGGTNKDWLEWLG